MTEKKSMPRGTRDKNRRRRALQQRWCQCMVLFILAFMLTLYIRFLFQIIGDTHPLSAESDVSYTVQAFYYPWYCNPQVDGRYMHWNHELIQHWDKRIASKYPSGKHDPDQNDIGASFFPQLGKYSSADPAIMKKHMQMLKMAGIGVAVVSWLPSSKHDDNGRPIASLLGPLLDAALEQGIRIAIHMEPYEDRTLESVRQDIAELLGTHGSHLALYRLARPGNEDKHQLPLLYFYDQYRVDTNVWKQLFAEPSSLLRGTSAKASFSIRNTQYDAVVLALIVERTHWEEYVTNAGFDGGYTYFAAKGFTFGSTPHHWKALQEQALSQHKLFVPSVGPGYDDTRVRPWNAQNTHVRNGGLYFDQEWQAAIESSTSMVSITSFNEWHEGTQIEPAVTMTSKDGWKYKDYSVEGGPESYLKRNKKWVERFTSRRAGERSH